MSTVGIFTFHTKAKSMDGMDKYYDSYIWTKTHTTNIKNDLGTYTYISHLMCQNPHCDYLQHTYHTFSVYDIEIDSFTK
jgi:hypothetical protein